MERQQEGGEVTTKVTVRMPVELVKALKHMAIDEGRTFQDLVAEAVRRFLGR
jgi:predicted DNA binding CopG/RHH family protein